ncbi:MAG: hypothetical protein CSA45_01730 [Gammaproteobacteria bacterium]|nr:MAG: hypothetical protein CSA45_01730 [Gammaproteobacteria bacterium]
MKKIVSIILGVLAFIIVLPLAYNNAQMVTFDYFFGTYQLPMSWLIFGAFIAGVLLSLVFFALTGWGWKLKAKGLQKQVNELIKQRKRDEISEQFKAEQKNLKKT